MADDRLIFEEKGPYLHITVNRPDDGNKFLDDMLVNLADRVNEATAKGGLNGIVLRGTGPDFSHGREQKPGPDGPPVNAYDARTRFMDKILNVYAAFRAFPSPIITVVQGKALGFACALVAGSDVAFASTKATFALPEMHHGTPPTLAISAHTKVAAKTVAHLVYSAEEIDAQHALASGLVSRLCEPGDLDATVDRFLETLGGFDALDIATVKKYIATSPGLPPEIASDLAGYTMATIKSRHNTYK
jgi:enoyl-CoA hydratase/carnithine racemase